MVDLIKQIDFKKEVSEYQTKLPQNIQAIRVYLTNNLIVVRIIHKYKLEPNSRTLAIDSRLIIEKQSQKLYTELLTVENPELKDIQPQLFSAFLGILSLKNCSFVVLAENCTHHSLHPVFQEFFQISSTVFIPFQTINYQWQEMTDAIMNLKQLLSKGFYFTYEHTNIDREEYQWNSYMCQPLYKYNIQNWDILMIQGFIDSFQVYQEGKRIIVALIAKRSIRSGGTRTAQTGVSKDGSVANFVETEQIVSVANIKCSFKQIRGSAPIHWRQKGMLIKQLDLYDDDENLACFQLHFDTLIKKYQRVLAINLMNKDKQTEMDLIKAYELNVQKLKSDKLRYIYYNFDEHTQGMDFQVVNKHILANSPLIKSLLFDAYDMVQKKQLQTQRGIIRTNCLACLDRTNVYQQRLGLYMMEQQLTSMGVNLQKMIGVNVMEYNDQDVKSVIPIVALFKLLWADHGDQISYLYSGTGSIHSNQERQGQQSFFSILGSGMVPLSRFYRNNFSEHIRQESIVNLLGTADVTTISKFNEDITQLAINIDHQALASIKYENIIFRCFKQSAIKWNIYGVQDNKVISIQCYNNQKEKYKADLTKIQVQKQQHIKIKTLDLYSCFAAELGNLNLLQLCNQTQISEDQFIQILADSAQIMDKYLIEGLILNGLNHKSVWFNDGQLNLDAVTHPPTQLWEYPSVIKEDFMDPDVMQRLSKQEQALEFQDNITNPTDQLDLNTEINIEEVEKAQIWILGRIIFVAALYPQPIKTNSIELMKPYLEKLSQQKHTERLGKILTQMMNRGITKLSELIQEIQKLQISKQQIQVTNTKIQYSAVEYKQAILLDKHFKQPSQGLEAIAQLRTLGDLPFEDEIQLAFDTMYFYVLQQNLDEALLVMEDLLSLYDQFCDRDVPALRQIVIEASVLLMKIYQIQDPQKLVYKNMQMLEFREILDSQSVEFQHPLISVIYFIQSINSPDDDIALDLGLKALDSLRVNMVQNTHLRSLLLTQILRVYIRKGLLNDALYFANNQLKLILTDGIDKLVLQFCLAKLMQITKDPKASDMFANCISLATTIYKDANHRRVKEIQLSQSV